MMADWFLAALRHDRAVVLGSLAAVVALAWAWLLVGAGVEMATIDMGGGQTMVILPEWTPAYGLVVFLMWGVMMLAMMLPSAAPVTLLVAGIARRRTETPGRAGMKTTLFVAGYIAVWLAFAAVATALQWQLQAAGLMSETMTLTSVLAAGLVLIAAGAYQWTPLKAACLRHCRSPLDFLLHHWRDGAVGSLVSGVRHGVFCFGCCWMLMALLFVGGIMNLLWIGGIALLVLIEKVLPWGGRMGRLTGAVLVVWGSAMLLLAAGAAAQGRSTLKPDGTRMIVEPMAGDRLEDNLSPVGRLYCAGSTMICIPTSLSQEVSTTLGAQAGEAKLQARP